MASGVVTWSQTAATNATADSAVNFAEGQAPSSLNDSARGLMASVAKWRDDIAGAITTGGTSTAYTVTSNQTFAALTAGYVVAFVPHTTNGATVTINVDGLGAKPLRTAPATELQSGVLIEGTPYTATYFTSNSGEWIIHGIVSNYLGLEIGMMMPYVSSTAPNSSYALPYGQALSRTTYSALFTLCGITYGNGDGVTTFNIPDLRGRAIFGKDDMGGSAASRVTTAGSGVDGLTAGATGGAQTVTLTSANIPTNVKYVSTSASSSLVSAGAAVDVYPPGVHSTGTGTAINKMPPAIILPYIMRII